MALGEGIINYIPSLISYIPKLISSIINGFKNGFSQMNNVGKGFVNNLLNGIKSSFGAVTDFFSNMINKIGEMWNKFTSWIKSAFKTPHFTFSGSMNPAEWVKGNLPKIGVEWYAKGGIMTNPTMFGYNPSTGNAMVGGEAGAEAIAPIDTLQQYVSEAVKKETSDLAYGMNKLIDLLSTYLPDIKDNMNRPVILDSGKVVGGIAEKMDNKLGDIMTTKARYGV